MTERAKFTFGTQVRDTAALEAASLELWTDLPLNEESLAALKRDGLDPGALRLSGPHPFHFASTPDAQGACVMASAADKEGAEALLDLFRIYFLRRLQGD